MMGKIKFMFQTTNQLHFQLNPLFIDVDESGLRENDESGSTESGHLTLKKSWCPECKTPVTELGGIKALQFRS